MTIPTTLATDLRPLLSSDALVTDAAALPAYGHDFWTQRGTPGIVVRAARAEDVVATLRYAGGRGIAVVPRAAGTNVSAGFLPTPARIMLDLRPMNRLLTMDTERREAVVQPGVINGDLNARLAPLGFCFSPDPGSAAISSIGGNIAENAGGMHCLKYGVTDDHINAIKCALIGGDTVGFAADDGGPDLLGLLIGSEGTLGIVTEATVALRPLPAVTRTLLAVFDDADEAAAAVSATIAAGIIPAAMEFFDRAAVGFFDAFSPSGSGYPAEGEAFLLIDLDGSVEEVSRDMSGLELILRRGTRSVHRADDDAARAALWKPRIDGALALVASGRGFFICDTTVPRERIPAMQRAVVAIGRRAGLQMLTLGHAGDGNIHPVILFDKDDPAQIAAMEAADDAVVAAALALGGTITGEHGIGSEKRRQMRQRFSPTEIAAMRAVKAAFDPNGLLNPGILLPDPAADEPALPRFAATMRDLLTARRAGRAWANRAARMPDAPPADLVVLDGENLTVTMDGRTPLATLHDALAARGFRCALAKEERTTIASAVSDGNDRAAVRDALLAVETTLHDGQTARFGSNAVKDVAGYDMKRLFIGSGGAFGTLERVTLRILPAHF